MGHRTLWTALCQRWATGHSGQLWASGGPPDTLNSSRPAVGNRTLWTALSQQWATRHSGQLWANGGPPDTLDSSGPTVGHRTRWTLLANLGPQCPTSSAVGIYMYVDLTFTGMINDRKLCFFYLIMRSRSEANYFIPLDMKGVSSTLWSGRYILSYPRGRFNTEPQNNPWQRAIIFILVLTLQAEALAHHQKPSFFGTTLISYNKGIDVFQMQRQSCRTNSRIQYGSVNP